MVSSAAAAEAGSSKSLRQRRPNPIASLLVKKLTSGWLLDLKEEEEEDEFRLMVLLLWCHANDGELVDAEHLIAGETKEEE